MPNHDENEQPIAITLVTKEDEPAVRQLLADAGLPHEDFSAHLDHFLVARRGKAVVGAVGLEYAGSAGLLRSLVVAPGERRKGIGTRLWTEMAKCARLEGVRQWYLLTGAAEPFFRQHGFQREDRNNVPASIAATKLFAEPTSDLVICMKLQIDEPA
jgi:N-acetylglutamate synthase-like GNAT family acetyltransferase